MGWIDFSLLEDLWAPLVFLGGVLSTFIPITVRAIRMQGGFRLSGVYVSRFEDEEEGQRFVKKSECRIKQLGGNIWFFDKTPEGRSWTLRGELDSSGRILGKYSADAVHDTGIGVFYFACERENESVGGWLDLDGFWAGYDHAGQQALLSGRYWMTRIMQTKIRKATRRDYGMMSAMAERLMVTRIVPKNLAGAVRIGEEALGSDYVSLSSFDIDYGNAVLLKATENGHILGFVIAYRLNKGLAREVVYEGDQNVLIAPEVRAADLEGTLGVIKTVAVDATVQGRGVGTRLVRSAERALKKNGVSEILVPAWENGAGEVNIGGVLNHLGYVLDSRINHFWKDGCDAGEFVCPEGRPGGRCVCNAIFFRKNVRKSHTGI